MTAEQIREQVPSDARLFPLIPNTKKPRSEHAHLDAVPLEQFLELYISGNYGIALDGQFLLVDKDRDDEATQAFEAQLPATWMQRTWKRGTHRLYRVPPGFVGKNNRWPGGELKVNGYLVGPGSVVREGATEGTYELTSANAVEPAPEWLLDMVAPSSADVRVQGFDLDVMSDGTRDNALASIAGFLRHKGYSEKFLVHALTGIVESGVVEQPPGREITSADVARIAKSIAKNPAGTGAPPKIAAADWVCGADVRIVGAPVRWWTRGFFPKNELVMVFGASGVGKSSLASWVASVVTNENASMLFVGVEEPFTRFLGRAVLCGAQRERLFAVQQASRILLPRDVDVLRDQIKLAGVSVLYFDAIVHHFERVQGENIAERARRCLGPLAEMAQELGITVIGVFHENRAGDYMGSAEMINVARVVLHAEREKEPPGQPLVLGVHTTNLWEPPYELAFYADEQPLRDPNTGEVQMEEVEPGRLEPMTVRVPNKPNRREKGIRVGDVEGDEDEPTP